MTSANRPEVPVWEKANLTLEESAAYFGIGINKLRATPHNPSSASFGKIAL